LIRLPEAAAGRIKLDNMALFAAIINILMDCTDSCAETRKKHGVPCDEGQKKIILLNRHINNTDYRR